MALYEFIVLAMRGVEKMNFKIIESPANPIIKEILRIRDGKQDFDLPGKSELWFAEGFNVVHTAALSRAKLVRLLIEEDALKKHSKAVGQWALNSSDILIISRKVAERLSDAKSSQGLFALVRHGLKQLDGMAPCGRQVIPVMDRIQDPGNLGTILRTADAFGMASAILIEGTCSPLNPKVVRSSAGSVFNMDLAAAQTEEFLNWVQLNKVCLLVADANAQTTLEDIVLSNDVAIVLGNEAQGVSEQIRAKQDGAFRIPICGRAESLNVAVSAAIVLYELNKAMQKLKAKASGPRPSPG